MNLARRLFGICRAKMIIHSNGKYLKSSQKHLEKIKNSYQGKRCFIIGNGPSLTPEDLDTLHQNGEICFGTHRIYQIFDQTDWRPTFYCAQDAQLIERESKNISAVTALGKYIAILPQLKYRKISDATYIKMLKEPFFPNLPCFSENMCIGEYEGFTVTYFCIQLAIYMGFREIYLLGIDHSYSIEMNSDGTIKEDKAIKDHFSENDTIENIPRPYMSSLAYYAARQYADAHGIRIYNATRGGKLDVFERIDIDYFFQKKK